MCRWWGLAPRVCLGEQERDPRICILCMFLLTCTLMKVKGLSYYVGSRSQVWLPLPHSRPVGPKFVFLVCIQGFQSWWFLDFWGTLNNMWWVLEEKQAVDVLGVLFIMHCQEPELPGTGTLGTLCPWLQHGCWHRLGRNTGHREWANELIRANGICTECYQKQLRSGTLMLWRGLQSRKHSVY